MTTSNAERIAALIRRSLSPIPDSFPTLRELTQKVTKDHESWVSKLQALNPHLTITQIDQFFKERKSPLRNAAVLVAINSFDKISTDQATYQARSHMVDVLPNLRSTSIILTKRSASMPNHAGEISFPGGGEKIGESPLHTAIREAQEEIALQSDNFCPLGALEGRFTLGHFYIIPIVGMINCKQEFKKCDREVDRIIEVPMLKILNSTSYTRPISQENDIKYQRLELHHEKDIVWGATAQILRQFFEKLTDQADTN